MFNNAETSRPATDKRASKSRTLHIFEKLRAEILNGDLQPGTRLHLADLAQRFSVSLGAIREALSRLVADGLVIAHDRRGFHVSPVSVDDLRDVTTTRIEIEGVALRRAIRHGDAAWEAEIIASLHLLTRATPELLTDPRLARPKWVDLHERFHRALIVACDSPWLMRIRQRLFEQSERYRALLVTHAVDNRDIAQEHQDLADATLARNADQATELLEIHFSRTMNMLLEAHETNSSVLTTEAR